MSDRLRLNNDRFKQPAVLGAQPAEDWREVVKRLDPLAVTSLALFVALLGVILIWNVTG